MSRGVARRAVAVSVALVTGVAAVALPMQAAAVAGTWSVVPSPNGSTTNNNFLFSVDCVSASDCWAVGQWVESVGEPLGVSHPLTAHYDGSTWTMVIAPDGNSASENYLQSISCVSTSDCWAAGAYRDSAGRGVNLYEHYDGTAWTLSGPASPQSGFLNDVFCVSTSDCWAVGFDGSGNPIHEHFNGSAWTNLVANTAQAYQGVTCVSATLCWGVGVNEIDRYDGTSWSPVATPAALNTSLHDVTCLSAGNCWTTGDYDVDHIRHSLIEHYDGTAWSIVSSPNPANSAGTYLNGISCAAVNDCRAVGLNFSTCSGCGSPAGGGVIEQYDGVQWSLVPDSAFAENAPLSGVSCTSTTNCWAVGDRWASTHTVTVIEHSTSSAVSGADLAVNLRAASTSIVGRTVTYHLHLTNRGPLSAARVKAHFSLPGGTTFVSATGGGTLDANADSVRWSLGTLAPGAKLDLTVTLRMDQVKGMRAFASASSSTADPNSTNNKSTTFTRVSAAP